MNECKYKYVDSKSAIMEAKMGNNTLLPNRCNPIPLLLKTPHMDPYGLKKNNRSNTQSGFQKVVFKQMGKKCIQRILVLIGDQIRDPRLCKMRSKPMFVPFLQLVGCVSSPFLSSFVLSVAEIQPSCFRKSPFLKFGKPSISIGYLDHGYVKSPEGYLFFLFTLSNPQNPQKRRNEHQKPWMIPG